MSTPNSPAQHEPQPTPAAYAAPAASFAPPAAPAPTSAPLASHNVFALLSIITVCMSPILGLVLGHIGLSTIKRTREAGRGLALTAVILGYAASAAVVVSTVVVAIWFGIALTAFGELAHYGSYTDYGYDY